MRNKKGEPRILRALGHNSLGGFVYIARGGDGAHKIGKSAEPRTRKYSIRDSNGKTPVIVHKICSASPFWLEEQLHAHFCDKWIKGEWFSLSDEDVSLLSQINYCSHPDDLPDWCPPHPSVRPIHRIKGMSISLELAEWLDWCAKRIKVSPRRLFEEAFLYFLNRVKESAAVAEWEGLHTQELPDGVEPDRLYPPWETNMPPSDRRRIGGRPKMDLLGH